MSPLLIAMTALAQDPDPRLWLEDVDGEESLGWVKERNAEAAAASSRVRCGRGGTPHLRA